MSIRLDRLEACYQANRVRRSINMRDWDKCLIGGYSGDLGRTITQAVILHRDSLSRAEQAVYGEIIGEHFGISRAAAEDLFSVTGSVAKLRQFIDDHTPKLAQMDYKEPHAAKECLTKAL